MEGAEEFSRQLKSLGYAPRSLEGNRIAFRYQPRAGRFKGQKVELGLEIPPEFPRTPPPGLHVTPQLLPLNPGASAHPDRVATSSFGADWQYWSRPFPGWRGREGVATYLAYVDRLFADIE